MRHLDGLFALLALAMGIVGIALQLEGEWRLASALWAGAFLVTHLRVILRGDL